MNGTDFRSEYKKAMEEITPDSELIKRISRYMKQPETAPKPMPDQSRSFFSRHKAILTAAATLAVVIGICAVGTIVVSHFNSLNNMTGSASLNGEADGAVSIADEEYSYYYAEKDNIENTENKSTGALASSSPPVAPGAAGGLFDSSDAAAENDNEGIEGTENITESPQQDNFYSDSLFRELSEKARNETLTVDDLGKDVTIEGDDPYYQAFCSFMRNSVSYTLIFAYKSTGGKINVINLYITESEESDMNRTIDLINSPERIEDYFAGDFSEEEE